MTPSQLKLPDFVSLGEDCKVDPGVILGYLTGRHIDTVALTIGPGACICSGTVIYAGSTIGVGLQTEHNVVMHEENTIGEGPNIWNNSTIDEGCIVGDGVNFHCNVYVGQ